MFNIVKNREAFALTNTAIASKSMRQTDAQKIFDKDELKVKLTHGRKFYEPLYIFFGHKKSRLSSVTSLFN